MTERRFIVDPADVGDRTLTLRRDDARHAERVLRLSTGAEVTCIDGRGNVWLGRIKSYGRGDAVVEIERKLEPEADVLPRLHLALSVIRGELMDLAVQKATELGAHSFTPVLADRVEARLTARRFERWHRIVGEATKQCERTAFMELRDPLAPGDLLATAGGESVSLVERGGMPAPAVIGGLAEADDVTLLVGPEGGWSKVELGLFRENGVHEASLGGTILRSETAAIAALAVARSILGTTGRLR